MATVLAAIITPAFKDINQIAGGESPSSAEQADALARLNQILGQLSDEGLMAFNRRALPFALQVGVSAYTLGNGGTFNAGERIQRVDAWRAYYGSVLTSGGRVLGFEEFGAQARQMEGETTSVPRAVGADTAYPLINVRVFPPPSSSPGTIEFFGWAVIAKFSAVSDNVSMPDGWEICLRTLLALDLYPSYPREAVNIEVLAANAQKYKAAIMGQNNMLPPPPAQ